MERGEEGEKFEAMRFRDKRRICLPGISSGERGIENMGRVREYGKRNPWENFHKR